MFCEFGLVVWLLLFVLFCCLAVLLFCFIFANALIQQINIYFCMCLWRRCVCVCECAACGPATAYCLRFKCFQSLFTVFGVLCVYFSSSGQNASKRKKEKKRRIGKSLWFKCKIKSILLFVLFSVVFNANFQ